MSGTSITTIQYLVFAYAIGVGVFIGCFIVLLNKYEKYIGLVKTDYKWLKMIEGGIRTLLSIASIYIVFIMPIDLIEFLIGDLSYLKKTYNIYFFTVVCSSIISIYILIRQGKIKINKKHRN